MMKHSIIIFGLTLVMYFGLYAQKTFPVRIESKILILDSLKYELQIDAYLDDGWHIYSCYQPKEAISIPTKLEIESKSNIKRLGRVKEEGRRELYEDHAAGIKQYQYENHVRFSQIIIFKEPLGYDSVHGNITIQVCAKMCLPPKIFHFSVAAQ